MRHHLQDYLLDDRLFKTISVQAPSGDWLIKMTLGGMLERMEELSERGDAGAQVQEAREALERAKRMMSEQYYTMLAREAKSYLDSWNWFLQNCWEGEPRCKADYPQEVAIRLRLAQIMEEAGGHDALAESHQRLQQLDERLQEIWQPGPFCMAQGNERYPREGYWWLYGHPEPQRD